MSHISRLRTRIVSEEGLVKALADLGYERVQSPGRTRSGVQNETIIVFAPQNQPSSTLTFIRAGDEPFNMESTDQALRGDAQAWLDRLTQRYAYHVAQAKLAEQGFTLIEETVQEGERIHLVLRRFV